MIVRMGKRKLGESDSDVSDEDDSDDEKENETSTILNCDSQSNSSKEALGSLDSVTGGKMGGVSCESGSEEEKEIVVQATIESGGFSIRNSKEEQYNVIEADSVDEKMIQSSTPPCSEPAVVAGTEVISAEKMHFDDSVNENKKEEIDKHPDGSGQDLESTLVSNADCSLESNQDPGESIASQSIVKKQKPLTLFEFNSAAELEVCFTKLIS